MKVNTVSDVREFMNGKEAVEGEVSVNAILVALSMLLAKIQDLSDAMQKTNRMLDEKHNG